MDTFLKLIISGLFSGSIYCLMAIGYVVVYKATKVLNFSQGMIVVLGAYVLWGLLSMGMPVWIAILLSFILVMGAAMFIERFMIRPLVGQPILASVMVTLALMGGLRGFILVTWGSQGRSFPVQILPRGIWMLGPVGLPKEKGIALMAAFSLIILLYLFFKYTRTGLGMRVTSEDHFLGQIVGLRINRVFSYSWAITGLVGAIGGLFLGGIISIYPELEEIGLKAVAAMLLGGLESFPGAIIGGMIIGLVEALSGGYLTTYISQSIGEVIPYIMLIIVLLIRPYGLFGWEKIERV
jgi:branched-chain amino acid transport system permease protein